MNSQRDGQENDGIQELDNLLPNWWLGTLYGTIAFAAAYFVYYCAGDGPTLVQEYEREHARAEYAALQRRASSPEFTRSALQSALKDAAKVQGGRAIFQSKCASCHGAQAEGGIGPNLTDDFWLHGGQLEQIAQTISGGVADKGMPPWGPLLQPGDVPALVAFIRSTRGSRPDHAKAGQGEAVTIKD